MIAGVDCGVEYGGGNGTIGHDIDARTGGIYHAVFNGGARIVGKYGVCEVGGSGYGVAFAVQRHIFRSYSEAD